MPSFFVAHGDWRRAVLPALLLTLTSAAASPARAYEDRLSLDLSLGALVAPNLSVGGRVGGSLGLSDAWTLRTAIGYNLGLQGPVTHSVRTHLDALYLIDIVEWVPFFGLRLGGEILVHPQLQVAPFGGVVGGLDHFLDRDVVVGIDVAWTPLLRDESIAQMVTFSLRLSLLFDAP